MIYVESPPQSNVFFRFILFYTMFYVKIIYVLFVSIQSTVTINFPSNKPKRPKVFFLFIKPSYDEPNKNDLMVLYYVSSYSPRYVPSAFIFVPGFMAWQLHGAVGFV